MAFNNEGFALEITADVKGFNAKLAEARKSLEKFQREAASVKIGGTATGAAGSGNATALTAQRKFTASVYAMGSALDAAVRSLARFNASLNNSAVRAISSPRVSTAMGAAGAAVAARRSGMGAGGMLMALPGAAMVGALAAAPIYKGISEFGKREKLRTDLGTLMRSDTEGAGMAQRIQNYAASTPYSQNDLAGTAKLLLQYGSSAGEAEKLMKQVGDIAMGNGQQMSSLGLVLGQVKSAGKLNGQDLMQFINAGWNPLSVLSEMSGQSIGDLNELASQGKISFEMIAKALEYATSEGGQFYKGAERGAKTLQGLFSTIQDNISTALAKIVESQEPAIKELATKWANFDWSKIVSAGSDFFQLAVSGFGTLSDIMQGVAGHAEVLKQVFMAMGAAAAVSAEMKFVELFDSIKNLKGPADGVKDSLDGVGASAAKTQIALLGITWGLGQLARLGSALKELWSSARDAKAIRKEIQERDNTMKSLGGSFRRLKSGTITEKQYQSAYEAAQRITGDLTGSMYDIWSKPENTAARQEAKRSQTIVIDKSKKEVKQTNNIKVDESRFAKVVKENLEMLLSSQLRLDNDLTSVQATAG